MAIADLLGRRIRADDADDSDEALEASSSSSPESLSADESESHEAVSDGSDMESTAESQDGGDDDDDDDDDNDDDDIQASLSTVSFGALAKAQSSLGPNAKRKRGSALLPSSSRRDSNTPAAALSASTLADLRSKLHRPSDKNKPEPSSRRPSKHAPTVQSSKHAVSRKRTVVEPPATAKSRDPRFDPTVVGSGGRGTSSTSSATASKAYAFLDEYRASEMRQLQEKIGKTKDAAQKEALKRELRSMADRLRTLENKRREQAVRAEHKHREKQLLREGKKSRPYYLKKSELKSLVLKKKYDEMGSRERARAMERRRKKVASRERREMPMQRRGA